jgi:asparagine synthase (glutamine-hydrolysing)
VEERLEADVPLGLFLSGGIDSALVCAYASQARRDLTAFTVRMPDRSFDESAAAAETARVLGLKHEILDCTCDPVADLQAIIAEIGLPFGDSSLLPSMWVSRAARTVSKVALGGDGGDEIFMGYDRHRVIRLLWRMQQMPPPIRERFELLISPDHNPKSLRSRAARLCRAATHNGYPDLLAIFPGDTHPDSGVVLLKDFDGKLFTESETTETAVWNARAIDLDALAGDMLRKTDSASMHVGLEVRSPFLAKEVAQCGLGASIECLMPRGERKGLLKAVARRYLPESIVNRPKQGFAIPIGEWFRNDFGGMRTFLLDSISGPWPRPYCMPGVRINPHVVQQMITEHMERRVDHSQRLYMLLVLRLWLNTLKG